MSLPDFESSRTIIVEVRTTNGAGLQSSNGVRFIEVDLDTTAPTTPELSIRSRSSAPYQTAEDLVLDIGATQDPESLIDALNYRIVNAVSGQPQTSWEPVVDLHEPVAHIQGASIEIPRSLLAAGTAAEVQVQVQNQEGLSAIATQLLVTNLDTSPPVSSVMLLEPHTTEDGAASLKIYLGPAFDQESGIARVRYRITDQADSDTSLVSWTDLDLEDQQLRFEGTMIVADMPALSAASGYRIDAEFINHAGLATRVSGVFDDDARQVYLNTPPAKPAIELFYFSGSNAIRTNQLEVRIAPPADRFTVVDSVQYRYRLYDKNNREINGNRRAAWQRIAYENARPDLPILLNIPVRAPEHAVAARVDLRLSNDSGVSPLATALSGFGFSEDTTPPSTPRLDYVYAGYHNAHTPNTLSLIIQDANDPESRIANTAYRIVNANNESDIVIDWTDVPGQQSEGRFTVKPVSIALPEFNRDRQLNIEVRLTNGAGLETIATKPVQVVVDRTPPEMANAELLISGENDQTIPSSLTIYPGHISDPESRVTSVSYRVSVGGSPGVTLADWTPLELIPGTALRFPPVRIALPDSLLSTPITFEVEAQNEAGLTVSGKQTIQASLDNSAPQMPRVEVSYQESELGTGFLLIEPGAFRDVESRIAKLEYRLVDSNDPEFVLMDWIPIPVPREVRVSVAPIAIPRDNIPFDGTVQLAVEFRATNGAGLFSTRRSTLELPGDESPPEAPSLIVAHRNAYDPPASQHRRNPDWGKRRRSIQNFAGPVQNYARRIGRRTNVLDTIALVFGRLFPRNDFI